MREGAKQGPVYLFEEDTERQRLIDQARLIDPLTERLFRAAGLAAGMRVLDLGAGMGDASLLELASK